MSDRDFQSFSPTVLEDSVQTIHGHRDAARSVQFQRTNAWKFLSGKRKLSRTK